MSSRKLQQEFDKLQKKVAEGLQGFEDIYEKIGNTDNSSLKEKLEGDLRKEIKKLQRSRDQVKQWMGDNSNKLDKGLLADIRAKIENAMERFKEVEKVSKMKQFSNEGLELQTKLGARGLDEAKKLESLRYVTEVLDELSHQNELLLGEIAQFSHKKKLLAVQASIDELAACVERNNGHIAKLEVVLRNLENDRLEPEKIDEIRDDLNYYVENNQASDFVEYDDFYDLLELGDSFEHAPGFAPPDVPSSTASPSKDAEPVKEKEPAKEPAREKETAKEKEKEKDHRETKPVSAPAPVSASQSGPSTPAANGTSSRAPPPGLHSKPSTPVPPKLTVAEELKKKVLTKPTAVSPAMPAATPVAAPAPTAVPVTGMPASVPASAPASLGRTQTELPVDVVWEAPHAFSSLVHSRLQNHLPFAAISQQLEASLLNCPDSFDLERPRQYNPVNVHPLLVDYPQEPMYELNLATMMRKFDTDTLFFCFYYNEGQDNLSKWNAARELSTRGWVFNTETKQWFCKDTPKARAQGQNGDADDGSYKYFDYQSSWLVRRKEKYDLRPEVSWTLGRE